MVLNPGAYGHTSIALADAIRGTRDLTVIEVHISNVHARENFRQHSYVSPVAAGVIVGLGCRVTRSPCARSACAPVRHRCHLGRLLFDHSRIER